MSRKRKATSPTSPSKRARTSRKGHVPVPREKCPNLRRTQIIHSTILDLREKHYIRNETPRYVEAEDLDLTEEMKGEIVALLRAEAEDKHTPLSSMTEIGEITHSNNAVVKGAKSCERSFGLFATQDIQSGVFLGSYTGVVRREEDFDAKVDVDNEMENMYGFNMTVTVDWESSLVIDASKYRSELGYMNDYRTVDFDALRGRSLQPVFKNDSTREQNVMCHNVLVSGWPYIIARTSQRVRSGSELLCDYGEDFWLIFWEAYQRQATIKKMIAEAVKNALEILNAQHQCVLDDKAAEIEALERQADERKKTIGGLQKSLADLATENKELKDCVSALDGDDFETTGQFPKVDEGWWFAQFSRLEDTKTARSIASPQNQPP